MTEHKSCPFCGSGNVIIDPLNYTSGKPGKYRAWCQGCNAFTHWSDTPEEAWAAWDRRPPTAVPPGQKKAAPAVLRSAIFTDDLFFHKGTVYTRNAKTGSCYSGGRDGKYRRIRKADYQAAYEECTKAAGQVTA